MQNKPAHQQEMLKPAVHCLSATTEDLQPHVESVKQK